MDVERVMYDIPAVHLAMLYRAYAQGEGGIKSGTLLEDELAAENLKALEVLKNGC